MTAGSQDGARWRLARGARWLDATTLAGGDPYRVITLTAQGADLLRRRMSGGEVTDEPVVDALLARLERSGLLVGPPSEASDHHDVTVVIPAKSTAGPVIELLGRIPVDVPVVLVDDGSAEPLAPVAAGRTGVTVIRHETARGPAAARNAGAALARTSWIAFIDADTVPEPGWIAQLKGRTSSRSTEKVDDEIVAVAPRIVSHGGRGAGAWFENRFCALDLGETPGDVGIGRAVSYVPSAAFMVRAAAFRDAGGFNEDMHVGEDVDLIWRLTRSGRVRYQPDIQVAHRPRDSLRAALDRRRFYGTSAADLSRQHPGSLRHVDVSAWSLGPWLLAVVVHPVVGVLAGSATVAIAPRGMTSIAPGHARRLAAAGHLQASEALGRWLVRPMLPVTIVVGLLSPRIGRRLLAAVGVSMVAAGVADVRASLAAKQGYPAALRLAGELLVARSLDDAAYSAGVWQGVLRRRTIEPVLPRIRDLPRWWRRG